MPLYDYTCECGEVQHDVYIIHRDQDVRCYECGLIMRREFSLPAKRRDMTVNSKFDG